MAWPASFAADLIFLSEESWRLLALVFFLLAEVFRLISVYWRFSGLLVLATAGATPTPTDRLATTASSPALLMLWPCNLLFEADRTLIPLSRRFRERTPLRLQIATRYDSDSAYARASAYSRTKSAGL